MASDPYKYFRLEARELLEQLGKGVLQLEKGGDAETLARLLRHAHTLKGAARVVRQVGIAERAHGIESALAPFRDSGAAISADPIRRVLGLVDEIGRAVEELDARPTAPERPADEPVHSVRTGLAELDALLDSVIETGTGVGALRNVVAQLATARQLVDLVVAQTAPRSGGVSGDPRAHGLADELRENLRDSQRQMNAGVERVERELVQVRDAAEQLRLIPAAAMFTALERATRDAAEAVGKRVVFEARGGDIRLDVHVLGAMQQALVQLVRNAVAHGIETPSERAVAQKSPGGRVEIDVARRGRRVMFRCRDDGRGIDVAAVRALARERGIVTTSLEELNAGALARLLLRGGVSTATSVTHVSGRGIGLDVVRDVMEQLAGEVTVHTDRTGTTFEVVVPVSLASLETLLVESAGSIVAIPLDAVRRTAMVRDSGISRVAQRESIVHDGQMVPFIGLAEVLRGTATRRDRSASPCVIVEAGGGSAAIGVDRMLGTAVEVVRPLPELAAADPVIAGAGLDAQGTPRLVVDPEALVTAARRERSLPRVAETSRRSVLVIDDSLTTRMLEQSILESAGYDVDTAVSGEQALELARKKPYALFLVDVEMPGIDGFTFIERTRADPTLRDVPAILVTSRSSADDRRRGEEVGARGFIVKSEFDQTDLLARIRGMVE
jgi:two-component system, chemotaxis family, sensor kinase CheA